MRSLSTLLLDGVYGHLESNVGEIYDLGRDKEKDEQITLTLVEARRVEGGIDVRLRHDLGDGVSSNTHMTIKVERGS